MSDENPQYRIKEREEREALDRAWASNDKVQFDNVISHNNNTARISELALTNAVQFQEKMNAEHLISVQQEREHRDAREKHNLENNRYHLDRLYSVFPEEAAGIVAILEATTNILNQKNTGEPKA